MTVATILGGAALPIGKIQSTADADLHNLEHELLLEMVLQATEQAGVEKKDIGSIVMPLMREYTKQRYFAIFMANALGIECSGSMIEARGYGLAGGLALDLGLNEILLGRAKVALVMGANFESAIPAPVHASRSMRSTGDVDFHMPGGFIPISWYAMDAVRYMHEHGATRAEIAHVAVKNRYHASLNPLSQFRKPITVEDVLAARPIVDPLGLLEVPGRSDGVVCLVVASEDVAKATGRPYARVRGRGFQHDGSLQIDDRGGDMTAFVSAQKASATAYGQAGIQARDLDFAEVYAPCTIVEVLVSEALGFFPRGQGARGAVEGETTLGGRIPISTSGSLMSRGHPPNVTGLYNALEVFDQLTGRAGERQVKDAALGLCTSELGNYNAAMVHVMEGVQ
jgi:acetyl-CoA C-acetyltransferase